jgi:hypothetical protein
MRIHSPLSNLRELLAQVRSSAVSSKIALSSNEAATRSALIDPVLRGLGWDTANVYMVEIEKTLGQTRADYALYENGGEVKVIIEAKKLGDNLAQHDVKLVNYAFTFKLTSIFLTDGLTWLHYTTFNPANFSPTKILNIAQDDLGEIASYLVQHLDAARLWPEDQNVDTLTKQLAQIQSDMATLQQEIALLKSTASQKTNIPSSKPMVTPPQPNSTTNLNWTPLDVVNPKNNLKPTALRLPDGQEFPITSWKQVLVESVKYALTHNLTIQLPLPDRSARKVCLLNLISLPDNISQLPLTYNSHTIYVYTNYDANNCLSNANYILNFVPVNQKPIAPAVLLA